MADSFEREDRFTAAAQTHLNHSSWSVSLLDLALAGEKQLEAATLLISDDQVQQTNFEWSEIFKPKIYCIPPGAPDTTKYSLCRRFKPAEQCEIFKLRPCDRQPETFPKKNR